MAHIEPQHETENTTPGMIGVVIDDRELQSNVPEYLKQMTNLTVSVRRLPDGDYLVNDTCLFERKTFQDFLISIVDGRLFDQAIRLRRSKFRPVLILEGAGPPNPAVSREAIQGAIIAVTVMLGIPLLRACDQEETARLIRYTGAQLARAAAGTLYRPGYRPSGERKRKLFILQGLPGIGAKRAGMLLEHFGSIKSIMAATPDELAKIAGIGEKTADEIAKIVSESKSEYGREPFDSG